MGPSGHGATAQVCCACRSRTTHSTTVGATTATKEATECDDGSLIGPTAIFQIRPGPRCSALPYHRRYIACMQYGSGASRHTLQAPPLDSYAMSQTGTRTAI